MELVLLAVLAVGTVVLVGMTWMLRQDLRQLGKRMEQLEEKRPSLLEVNGDGPQWMQEWLYGVPGRDED